LGFSTLELGNQSDGNTLERNKTYSDLGKGIVPFGTIILDSLWSEGKQFCERYRLLGLRNIIIGITGTNVNFSNNFIVRRWDGSLSSLIRACLDNQPVSHEELVESCRPFIINRLRHDLPNYINCPEDDTIEEFLKQLMTLVRNVPSLELIVKSYFKSYSSEQKGAQALVKLIWKGNRHA